MVVANERRLFMKSFKLYVLMFMVTTSSVFAQTRLIKIDGSSTVFPITEAVSEEFQTLKKGTVQVTVGISGTGGGFKKFCRGETDIQDASRPISKEEMKTCKDSGIQYIELPIAYDAITLCVSQKNTWLSELSLPELKKIWEPQAQRKIIQWNQVKKEWPETPLKLFGAGSDSGTFDYFTEAVNGKSKASRGDYTASEDDNTLVLGIGQDPNALGYLPFSYYEANKAKLKAIAIINTKNKAILPSLKTIVNGAYEPFSRPIFIYVNVTSLKKSEVKDYVTFYLTQAQTLVPQVKYVPLSPKAYQADLTRLQKNKIGTTFGGEAHIGMKIEDLLLQTH